MLVYFTKDLEYRLLEGNHSSIRCLEILLNRGRLPNLNYNDYNEAESKEFADMALNRGDPKGTEYLRILVEVVKFPNFHPENLDEAEFKKLADTLLEKGGQKGAACLKSLLEQSEPQTFTLGSGLIRSNQRGRCRQYKRQRRKSGHSGRSEWRCGASLS
ncbi:MAG: hypothetical protein LBD34_03340, partial [Puniceicoccales bacterium]|nr:hypothetical protein [Puniceicoccales bacterium]